MVVVVVVLAVVVGERGLRKIFVSIVSNTNNELFYRVLLTGNDFRTNSNWNRLRRPTPWLTKIHTKLFFFPLTRKSYYEFSKHTQDTHTHTHSFSISKMYWCSISFFPYFFFFSFLFFIVTRNVARKRLRRHPNEYIYLSRIVFFFSIFLLQ